jgi:GxxExxY protein
VRDKRTYAIIGAALEVHNELRSGFLEAVYQEALEKEFINQGIPYASQLAAKIYDKDQPLKKTYQPAALICVICG